MGNGLDRDAVAQAVGLRSGWSRREVGMFSVVTALDGCQYRPRSASLPGPS